MISPRFAPATAALIAFALVPTVIHSYAQVRHVDGFSAASIPLHLASMAGQPTKRSAAWVTEHLHATDWFERTYRNGAADVVLFVGRSYDTKRLYHHPELALLRGLGLTRGTPAVARTASRPDIPLHVIPTTWNRQRGFSVYALLHDGTFIEDPVPYQLRTAHRYLLRGQKPMTLFMATDLRGGAESLDTAPSTRILLEAIAAFQAQGPKSAP